MEQFSLFLQNQWYIAVIALIVLFLVVKLVKTVVKWVVVILIIAAVFIYGNQYGGKLSEIKDTFGTAVANEVKDQALKVIAGEAKEAVYKKNSDGTFTIQSKSVQLEGKPGSNDVKVTFMGQSFHLKADEVIQKFIDQAKQNQ